MEKTLLGTWSVDGKRGLKLSLVQRALQQLRERIAQHEAAWGDCDAAALAGGAGEPAGAGAGQRARSSERQQGIGAAAGQADKSGGLWRLLRRTRLQALPLITYVNVKASSCLPACLPACLRTCLLVAARLLLLMACPWSRRRPPLVPPIGAHNLLVVCAGWSQGASYTCGAAAG
jgi:hypothetical protein